MNTTSKLALVLGPISESEFFEHYWETNPLHVSRSSEQHYSGLLTVGAIESVLSNQALHFPSVQLTQLDRKIQVAEYTDESRRILPQRLIERHREGATIVISQAHEKLSSLARFRRDIQSELNLRCQTNVYLSPQGKQGFNAHFDSHDVFILQVAGTKTFNFYEGGIELPYQHDSFDASYHSVGPLTQSIALEPGDTLYIPRGVLHDAVATEETSLHITLGVYAITLRDVLMEMTQQLTDNDSGYRKSAPRDLLAQLHEAKLQNHDDLQRCLSPALTQTELSSALSHIANRLSIESAPDCHGMLSTNTKKAETIQLNSSRISSIERTSELIRLRTHGQVLEFAEPLKATVERLLNAEIVAINALDELDSAQKDILYARLECANLLITEKDSI